MHVISRTFFGVPKYFAKEVPFRIFVSQKKYRKKLYVQGKSYFSSLFPKFPKVMNNG